VARPEAGDPNTLEASRIRGAHRCAPRRSRIVLSREESSTEQGAYTQYVEIVREDPLGADGIGLLVGPLYAMAAMARLRDGVSVEQARAVVQTQGRQLYYSRPRASPEHEPAFHVLRTNDVRMPFDPSAALIPARLAGALTIVVAVVLLIAAANIAGILLARGVGRASEIAVRRVLGAGGFRIVRQLLTESVLLAGVGGVLGFILAAWLLSLFRALTPPEFALEVGFEPAVVWFAASVCLAAGLIVGLLPAVQAARRDLRPWLASGGVAIAGSGRQRARHAITIPQVALSLALLLVGTAYVRTLLETETADLGYETRNLTVAYPVLRPDPGEDPTLTEGARAERSAERSRRFYRQLVDRLMATPDAADVAVASSLPIREASYRPDWNILSYDAFLTGDREGVAGDRQSVSPGYFKTLRIPLLAGRDIDARDSYTNTTVAVISTALAQRLWPGRDPIGRQVTAVNNWNRFPDRTEWFEVVGVVDEVSPVLEAQGSRPTVYFSLSQEWKPWASTILARGRGDSRTLIPALKTAVTSADPFADVTRTTTMQALVASILYPRRIAGAVLALSGLVALFLAIVGIYGVVSYSVAQRTGEIGVRMALGAERHHIIYLVLHEGMRLAVLGCLIGLALGYAAARTTANRYVALPPLDALTLLAVPVLLTAVILLACYIPARRAGLVDPQTVLRRS
jgi:predicted permease